MEGTAPPTPADEAVVGASPPTESAGSQPGGRPQLVSLEEAFRGPPPPGHPDAKDGDDPPTAVRTAPPRGDEAGRGMGRRARAAEANLTRIAELERALEERAPEKVREQVRAELEAERRSSEEQAAIRAVSDADAADAERYERLRDVPDRELSDDDYRWREDRKALYAAFPKARSAYLAEARREAAALSEQGWARLRAQYAAWADLPGVDRELIATTADLYAAGKHLYETGESRARAELQPKLDRALEQVRRLEAEAGQRRLHGPNGLAGARAPRTGGGRSAPPGPGRPDYRTSTAAELFEYAIRQGAEAADR